MEQPASATYVQGQTAVSVTTASRQEANFLVQRFGCVDGIDESRRWLTLEEAFYLASDRRIHIAGLSTHDAIWTAFTSADDAFASRYVAYSRYRSRGWIVQSGMLYGVTYVLYRMSPDVVHSEYMVYVHDNTSSSSALSWQLLQVVYASCSVVCSCPIDANAARRRRQEDGTCVRSSISREGSFRGPCSLHHHRGSSLPL
ncbi:tRNA-intron endonuclease, variant [Aphanomyces astaci]|uniref:tRNA-intron lyase n=1 Tax=Aphanomyces astaci TaxID=112090 RepID=W4FRU6_APHAT|nr:tRNA-intron endonuclease, variant [Aphanomyces astaci]ETV70197.1 tRNA-intron endonuclease, variant [Aphanomyces astaci]|eukprot:XP_009840292.1 tRNA-intron endonuclease, variant [Aphanomyces astaci]